MTPALPSGARWALRDKVGPDRRCHPAAPAPRDRHSPHRPLRHRRQSAERLRAGHRPRAREPRPDSDDTYRGNRPFRRIDDQPARLPDLRHDQRRRPSGSAGDRRDPRAWRTDRGGQRRPRACTGRPPADRHAGHGRRAAGHHAALHARSRGQGRKLLPLSRLWKALGLPFGACLAVLLCVLVSTRAPLSPCSVVTYSRSATTRPRPS